MQNLPAQQLCPLCQQANDCAIVQTGDMTSQCWCMHVKIAPEILEQPSSAQKNIACICSKCAQAFKSNL